MGIGIAVMVISLALDRIWAAALPMRTLYLAIRAPGVILHECSHIAGCLLTGARIRKVVFFSSVGGSVTYARPLLPYIGDVIISCAPLFGIPLVLSFLTMVFGTYLGCSFPVFPPSIDSVATFITLIHGIAATFSTNLVVRFNGWFLLYLYLTTSLVLSVAPSRQDLKNAAIGIFLLTLAGIMIVWSGIPSVLGVLGYGVRLLEIGFTLGLVYGLIALVISLPLIAWYAVTRR